MSRIDRLGGLFQRNVLMQRHEPFTRVFRSVRFGTVWLALAISTSCLGHFRAVQAASAVMSDRDEVKSFLDEGPVTGHDVEIVRITPDDYRRLFAATSPLDSNQLAGLVALLLHNNPRQLVVDIDTSEARFEQLPRQVAFLWHCLDPGCTPEEAALGHARLDLNAKLQQIRHKVVWARSATVNNEQDATLGTWFTRISSTILHWACLTSAENDTFAVDNVLGQRNPDVMSAVAMLQPDLDGHLRRVRPLFRTAGATDTSIPSIAVRALPEENVKSETLRDWEHEGELRLQFLRYLRGLTYRGAGEFLEKPGSLKDKTVFLGGTYYSAADSFYMSDGREYPGVEVLAAASLALRRGDILPHACPAWEFGMKLLFGVLVAYVNYRFRPVAGLVFVALLAAAVWNNALPLGWAMALNLAAFVVGLGIEQSVESAIEAEIHLRKTERELAAHGGTAT